MAMVESREVREGLVVRVDARQCEVRPDGPEPAPRPARLRGRLFEQRGEDRIPVAVGDRVRLEVDPASGELVVAAILPRRNLFARRVAGEDERRQLLAANLDLVVHVACFGTPPFSSVLADRVLVAASFAGIPAALVLNKTDLGRKRRMERVIETYRGAGYPVLTASAKRGEGIEELQELLRDRTSILYGLSGVGKSSLLNRIEPGLGLRTREVSRSLRSGRHTTTFAQLHLLACGGAVIDTPGVRVFRPYGLPPHELRLHYPELARIGRDCRFPDCLHRGEPGCAVAAALEQGRIPASRHRSYLELLAELESVYGGTGPTDAPVGGPEARGSRPKPPRC
ncbi:MAG: ribosome small subunit-dependent GTPase A [Planctomycetota bacterium]|nr:MAG: ribosome small subunit-dependent GTPase A [Planctomycetota bacterium]